MKKQSIFTLIIICMLFSRCNFSNGMKKDMNTGLSAKYKGFFIDDVKLVNAQGSPLLNNIVSMDSTFAISATGVKNYELKDGKAYPGCELTVKGLSGKIIGHAADVLFDFAKDGLLPANASAVSATVTLSKPLVSGETYHITARFFDQQNSKNEIAAEANVVLH